MKSSETQARCPACGIMTGLEGMKKHINRMANLERKNNMQAVKKHINYQISLIDQLKDLQIIKSKKYEEERNKRGSCC